MSSTSQGTELPNIRISDSDPTAGSGIPGIPNQLLIRTDTNQIYFFKGPLDTDWESLGSSGGMLPPSLGSENLEDFINATGINFVVDVAPAVGSITSSPNTRTVGIALLRPQANNSGISCQTTSAFTKQINEVGLGKLTLEWSAQLSDTPVGGADFTIRLLGSTIIQSGFGNGNCLGFSLGFAENGNSNWWAALNDATKFDTGVIADGGGDFHKFTVVHEPALARVQWFIDDVLTNTFNGVPSVNGLSIAQYASMKSISAGGFSNISLDYMYWKYDFTRP